MELTVITERVKLLSGENNEAIVYAYLDIAKEKILTKAFPFKDTTEMEVPSQYHSIWVEITVFLLNKRGAEGETSHTENGIARTYGNADVPDEMLKKVTPYCGSL